MSRKYSLILGELSDHTSIACQKIFREKLSDQAEGPEVRAAAVADVGMAVPSYLAAAALGFASAVSGKEMDSPTAHQGAALALISALAIIKHGLSEDRPRPGAPQPTVENVGHA